MNAYTIEQVLEGTRYKNSDFERGTITFAERRDNVYYDGGTAYAIRYRLDNSIVDKWATIVVLENK